MKVLIAEFAPDQPSLDSGASGYVNNVTPLTLASYGPIGALSAAGNALSLRCQGAASFRGIGGTVFNTAGDAQNLYSWDGTSWTDVSKPATTYAAQAEDFWSYAQFGNRVIAVNGTDNAQYWDIGISAAYGDLAGSPPIGRFVSVWRDFPVIGRLASAKNKLQWGAINSTVGWTVGTNQSDEQEIPVGGQIMGLAGGEYGVVFCESSIYRALYVNAPLIFQFDAISLEVGCAAEGSIAQNEQDIYFLSQDGFRLLKGGQAIIPIGDQKVDRWFWATVNQSYLYRIVSAVDPITGFYHVSFPSGYSSDGTPDMKLIFNPTIGRWSLVTVTLDYLFSARTNIGYHTDNIDTLLGNTDATTLSGDSSLFTGSARATLAAFGTDKKMAFFNGANMEATIDTVEGQPYEGKRSTITGVRALCDGGTVSVKIGYRNNMSDSVTYSSAVAQNANGVCPMRINARYMRGRAIISSGANWTHFQGLDVAAVEAGWR